MHKSGTPETLDLILVRHGESVLTAQNRFCGWLDAELSAKGQEEILSAAEVLKNSQYNFFDVAYTSYLKRAIKSTNIILEELDCHWVKVVKSWRLNERMYGALQGMNKVEASDLYGADKVKLWRRSYDIRPPAITRDDVRWPGNDHRYRWFDPECIPLTESCADVIDRILPFWNDEISRSLYAGKRVLVVTHGCVVRAIVKHIELDKKGSEQSLVDTNIPSGFPILYRLNPENLRPIGPRQYLHGDSLAKKEAEKVANQHLGVRNSSFASEDSGIDFTNSNGLDSE